MIEALWLDALLGLKWPEKLCVVVKQGQTWCNAELVLRAQTVSRKKNGSLKWYFQQQNWTCWQAGWAGAFSRRSCQIPTLPFKISQWKRQLIGSVGVFPLVMRPRATGGPPKNYLSPLPFSNVSNRPPDCCHQQINKAFSHRGNDALLDRPLSTPEKTPAGPAESGNTQTALSGNNFCMPHSKSQAQAVCLNAWHHGRRHEIQTGMPEKVTVYCINHTWLVQNEVSLHMYVFHACVYIYTVYACHGRGLPILSVCV